jgi:hypothetical protein
MVVVDAMEKTAGVRVLETELNDSPGVCMKLYGRLADIQIGRARRQETAGAWATPIIVHVIPGRRALARRLRRPGRISAPSSSSQPCSIPEKL